MLIKCVIFILCLIISTNVAYARIGGVSNATVDADLLRASWHSEYDIDDTNGAFNNRQRNRISFDYGVSDWYALLLIIQGQNLQGQSAELSNIFFDQRFELTNTQNDGYYSGVRVSYDAVFLTNKPDIAYLYVIAGKEIGAWDLRYNQLFGLELGASRKGSILVDTRFLFSYAYRPNQRIALETYSSFGKISQRGDFNKQSHSVGSTFFGALTDEVNYEVGYMAGITKSAPDHSFYVGLSRVF